MFPAFLDPYEENGYSKLVHSKKLIPFVHGLLRMFHWNLTKVLPLNLEEAIHF